MKRFVVMKVMDATKTKERIATFEDLEKASALCSKLHKKSWNNNGRFNFPDYSFEVVEEYFN